MFAGTTPIRNVISFVMSDLNDHNNQILLPIPSHTLLLNDETWTHPLYVLWIDPTCTIVAAGMSVLQQGETQKIFGLEKSKSIMTNEIYHDDTAKDVEKKRVKSWQYWKALMWIFLFWKRKHKGCIRLCDSRECGDDDDGDGEATTTTASPLQRRPDGSIPKSPDTASSSSSHSTTYQEEECDFHLDHDHPTTTSESCGFHNKTVIHGSDDNNKKSRSDLPQQNSDDMSYLTSPYPAMEEHDHDHNNDDGDDDTDLAGLGSDDVQNNNHDSVKTYNVSRRFIGAYESDHFQGFFWLGKWRRRWKRTMPSTRHKETATMPLIHHTNCRNQNNNNIKNLEIAKDQLSDMFHDDDRDMDMDAFSVSTEKDSFPFPPIVQATSVTSDGSNHESNCLGWNKILTRNGRTAPNKQKDLKTKRGSLEEYLLHETTRCKNIGEVAADDNDSIGSAQLAVSFDDEYPQLVLKSSNSSMDDTNWSLQVPQFGCDDADDDDSDPGQEDYISGMSNDGDDPGHNATLGATYAHPAGRRPRFTPQQTSRVLRNELYTTSLLDKGNIDYDVLHDHHDDDEDDKKIEGILWTSIMQGARSFDSDTDDNKEQELVNAAFPSPSSCFFRPLTMEMESSHIDWPDSDSLDRDRTIEAQDDDDVRLSFSSDSSLVSFSSIFDSKAQQQTNSSAPPPHSTLWQIRNRKDDDVNRSTDEGHANRSDDLHGGTEQGSTTRTYSESDGW